MPIATYLEKALGPFGVPAEAVRDLRCLFALGKPSKVAMPKELVPIGARLVAKGIWNMVFSGVGTGWVLPYWMERQFRPDSAAFIPRSHQLTAINSTYRNWTGLGLPGYATEGHVDPAGLVSPRPFCWSLDTWLVIGERAYFPSREKMKQRLVADTPVVETSGKFGAICFRQVDFAATWQKLPIIVHKVELSTTRKGAMKGRLIFCLRPYNVEGLSPVYKAHTDGKFLYADDLVAMVLSRPPDIACLRNYQEGDVAQALFDLYECTSSRCEAGLVTAALAYDLSVEKGHPVKFEVYLPIQPLAASRRELFQAAPVDTGEERIIAYWQKRTSAGMQIEVPDEKLKSAFEANKSFLLMLWDGGSITPGVFTYHHFWYRDAAYQLLALDRTGFSLEAEKVLLTYPKRQTRSGFFRSQEGEWDSNGQAIFALYHHYRQTQSEAFLRHVYPSVRKGAEWIIAHADAPPHGLLPAGFSAEHFGPNDFYYWDNFWAVEGLKLAARLAQEAKDRQSAARFRREERSYRRRLENSIDAAARRLGNDLFPTAPDRGADGGIIGNIAAAYPLTFYEADHPRMRATVAYLLENFGLDGGYYHPVVHSGLNVYLTLQIAQVLLLQGDRRAYELLQWALRAATDTGTYPEAIHPHTKGGCMGDGHHGWAVAELLLMIRNLLLHERGQEVHLTPLWPKEWEERGVCVREAPTAFGKLGFEIAASKNRWTLSLFPRWHQSPLGVKWHLPREPKEARVDNKTWPHKGKALLLPPTAKKVEVEF